MSPGAILTVTSARHILKIPKFGDAVHIQAVQLLESWEAAKAKGPIECRLCEGTGKITRTCGECGSDHDRKCPECAGTGDRLQYPYLTLEDIKEAEKGRVA